MLFVERNERGRAESERPGGAHVHFLFLAAGRKASLRAHNVRTCQVHVQWRLAWTVRKRMRRAIETLKFAVLCVNDMLIQ